MQCLTAALLSLPLVSAAAAFMTAAVNANTHLRHGLLLLHQQLGGGRRLGEARDALHPAVGVGLLAQVVRRLVTRSCSDACTRDGEITYMHYIIQTVIPWLCSLISIWVQAWQGREARYYRFSA